MTTYETLKHALTSQRSVRFVTDGNERFGCPHVIGTKLDKKTGMTYENVLFYQYAGHSTSGLAPDGSDQNWRCVHVGDIQEVQVVEERWHTVDVLPTKKSPCIDNIDAKVWL